MCIFTLFSVFSASLAWFEMIKNVGGTANSMPVQDHDGILSRITFHSLNSTYTTDSTYAFDAGEDNIRGELVMNWNTGQIEGNHTGNQKHKTLLPSLKNSRLSN